ncbi:MAG TPA: hypothetical protein VMQ52_01855 [Candidatus Saccharimonadales bacterium]|jgi:hypothetical protein|nr:hypothetical protein [Candidatus Saccharimonadales bacterium]
MNKLWHEKNTMPKKPSLGQRLHWHKQHLKHCGCRKPPEALAKLLKGE